MDEQPLIGALKPASAAAHTNGNRIGPTSAVELPDSALPEVATLLNAFRVLLLRHFINAGRRRCMAGVGLPSGLPTQDAATLPASVHVELLIKDTARNRARDILFRSSVPALTRSRDWRRRPRSLRFT